MVHKKSPLLIFQDIRKMKFTIILAALTCIGLSSATSIDFPCRIGPPAGDVDAATLKDCLTQYRNGKICFRVS
jgi:hypothetical protein